MASPSVASSTDVIVADASARDTVSSARSRRAGVDGAAAGVAAFAVAVAASASANASASTHAVAVAVA
eukprot:2615239-Pleurochrysis_carterae.AAC.2